MQSDTIFIAASEDQQLLIGQFCWQVIAKYLRLTSQRQLCARNPGYASSP
jgi:hypothetical protein